MLNQYEPVANPDESPINSRTILFATQLFITLIGLGMTLFGIKYSLDIFLLIYNYLQKPEMLSTIIEKWSSLLNIKELFFDDYPMDKLFVVVILAIGALLLLRITLGFIHAGTKILTHANNTGSNLNDDNIDAKLLLNLDFKLNKLKTLSEQGIISPQAYETARDKYWVQKIMSS